MIKSLTIVGFKRFAHQEVRFAPLTILAGVNGSGKTSVIQALLLAHEANLCTEAVRLNGPFGLRLGTALDVRNWHLCPVPDSIAARQRTGLHLPRLGRRRTG
jgi:hypothetical protein